MKIVHKILGILWLALCAYFCATLAGGVLRMGLRSRTDTLAIDLFFVLLYLGGTFVSFHVLTGARWARIALSMIALLTMAASLIGVFAFFNSLPFSAIGIGFDVFALASAAALFFSGRHEAG